MIDWPVFWAFFFALVVYHHALPLLRPLGAFFRRRRLLRERAKDLKEPWQ
ncbi:hypothetical protein GO613_02365 [Azoarcus communis]|nr:hypothetical protein [Parazoarcus communis]NMG46947.1 hypothetical protein [Parazoarcus communis]